LKTRFRLEDIIKMEVREILLEVVDGINPVHDRNLSRDLVNAVMSLGA
jgi:hypothetical protein